MKYFVRFYKEGSLYTEQRWTPHETKKQDVDELTYITSSNGYNAAEIHIKESRESWIRIHLSGEMPEWFGLLTSRTHKNYKCPIGQSLELFK